MNKRNKVLRYLRCVHLRFGFLRFLIFFWHIFHFFVVIPWRSLRTELFVRILPGLEQYDVKEYCSRYQANSIDSNILLLKSDRF